MRMFWGHSLAVWTTVILVGILVITLVYNWKAIRAYRKPLSLAEHVPDKWYLRLVALGAVMIELFWFFLLLAISWILIYIIASIILPIFDGEQIGELRERAWALGTLLLALGGLIAAPLALIRTFNTERQTEATEQGLITDRINKAVEALGAEKTVRENGKEITRPNIEMRIGAIFALERIAQDSPRDHIHIMEILCAYIRENAPASMAQEWPVEGEKPKPRIDIQTALTVIGRLSDERIKKERKAEMPGSDAGYRLDLRETCLQGADMQGLDFAHAQLDGACLQEASLRGAKLEAASLWGANLQEASLWRANLQGAFLYKAKMQNADLRWSNLQKTQLRRAELQDANFVHADLENAAAIENDFSETNILQNQINSMFGDASVILPEGIIRPAHWATEKLDVFTYLERWHEWLKSRASTPPPNKP